MKRLAIYLILVLLSGNAVYSQSGRAVNRPSGPIFNAYLFVYFTGGAEGEAIRYGISKDGFHYRALNANQPVVGSDSISLTGGIRDPHIMRGADGKTFYMVATDMHVAKNGWGPNPAMVLMQSTDLINWSHHTVNITETFPAFSKVSRVWAPQTIYDPKVKKYMIYWSMKTGNEPDKIYYAYANKQFSGLEGVPRQLFVSPDSSACIDGDIVTKHGKYHLFFKTEDKTPGIKMAVSDQLTTGYQIKNDRYLQQTTEAVEGAGTFKLNHSDTWILMYDLYLKGKYQFTQTRDLKKFTVIDQQVSMNFHPRHGTVIAITDREAAALVSKWYQPEDVILSAGSAFVKSNNLALDTASGKLRLPVRPGTRLTALDPGFISFPGVSISPAGARNFSNGPVKYVVKAGKSARTFSINAQEDHNPVIAGYYADPEILYARKTGKFYLYPTSDGFTGWSGNYFKTFSSVDLVNWKDEGVMLDLPRDVKWASKNAWAPCIEEKQLNGTYKYFYYFTAAQKIGVAVADDPSGPFVDSGKPLIEKFPAGVSRGQQIDPDVFTDPQTGKSYLYWGNGYMAGAELQEDMISIKPESTVIMTPAPTFREGTYVFYRKGKYYVLWSENDTRDADYQVRYGISDSPLGKISIPKENLVLAKDKAAGIFGTGHNAIIQLPGKDEWYIVYHRFNYPNGIHMGPAAGYNREVCIDRITFDAAGNIITVKPTHSGIKPVVAGN